MLRLPLLAVCMCISAFAFGQLSKGEGKIIEIPGGKFSCYLPKYFEIQDRPTGVIHKASGSFVIAVKVPDDKKLSVQGGLQREFFEDPRYEIITLREETAHKHHASDARSYWMKYKIQGFEFERCTTLVTHGEERYLVIGNYPVKLKDQVHEEVVKIMESFRIH